MAKLHRRGSSITAGEPSKGKRRRRSQFFIEPYDEYKYLLYLAYPWLQEVEKMSGRKPRVLRACAPGS